MAALARHCLLLQNHGMAGEASPGLGSHGPIGAGFCCPVAHLVCPIFGTC